MNFCKNMYFSEGLSTVKVLVNLPISVVWCQLPILITRKSRRLAKLSYSFLFVQEIDLLLVLYYLARKGWFNSLFMLYTLSTFHPCNGLPSLIILKITQSYFSSFSSFFSQYSTMLNLKIFSIISFCIKKSHGNIYESVLFIVKSYCIVV